MLELQDLENEVEAMFVYSPNLDGATHAHNTGVKVRGSGRLGRLDTSSNHDLFTF